MNIPPSAKYEIIREMTQRDNNLLNIRQLCESAGVSRSGYYHYLQTEDVRLRREARDRADFEIILEAYNSLYSELASPQLTAVDINSHQLGQEAARQIISYLENPNLRPTKIIVPHKIVPRNSCKRIDV